MGNFRLGQIDAGMPPGPLLHSRTSSSSRGSRALDPTRKTAYVSQEAEALSAPTGLSKWSPLTKVAVGVGRVSINR